MELRFLVFKNFFNRKFPRHAPMMYNKYGKIEYKDKTSRI